MRTVYRDDHEMFRDQVRRFIDKEIVPFHAEWETNGIVPKEIWLKAGEQGLLCVFADEKYGGAGIEDLRFDQIIIGAASTVR